MRLYEFASSAYSPDKLVALTQLIKGRAKNSAAPSSITVDAFIKMARNMGFALDRNTLTNMLAKPPLSNAIKSVEGDVIQFHGLDDEPVETPSDQDRAEDRVSQMAKRQIKK